jgi:hypothetical protein
MNLDLAAVCETLCRHIESAAPLTHEQRLTAASFVLRRLTGHLPRRLAVRAALYGPLAAARLGGRHVPIDRAEVEHFCEQAGPGLVLLGFASPHAILVAGGVMLELAHSRDWNDRGVLLRPFARPIPTPTEDWTIRNLRYGTCIAYQRLAIEPASIELDLAARRVARLLEAAAIAELRRVEAG